MNNYQKMLLFQSSILLELKKVPFNDIMKMSEEQIMHDFYEHMKNEPTHLN